jgi:hypothetical protein
MLNVRPLTIVGGVRDAPVVRLRGRGKTACARVARPAWSSGPSTSPLDVVMRVGSFALLISAIGLGGCIPVSTQVTPAVTGRIYSENVPVQDAQVYVIPWFHSKQCGPSSTHSTTSMQGTFTFAPIHETDWIFPIGPTARLFDWAVCINYKDRWVLGYAERDFAYLRHKSVLLTCDLSASTSPETAKNDGAQHGVCRADDV